MRVIALFAAIMLASMPYSPPKISPDAPAIVINSQDCRTAQSSADALAHAIGFSHARVNCTLAFRELYFSLDGPLIAPRVPAVPGLIAYSGNERRDSGAPRISSTAEIPSDVPFVAATGSIVGYVKLDALLLFMRPYNPLQLAFALEDAGVPRSDIVSGPEQPHNATLIVRVWPVTASQIEKIIGVAAKRFDDRPYFEAGFINDCNRVTAALGALAVMRAREHARAMARAAGTQLRQVIGVVDSGTNIPDASCGAPKNASVQQLAKIVANESPPGAGVLGPQVYATVTRSVSVAWKLDLPPNPPGHSWRTEFAADRQGYVSHPAFVADGLRANGDAIIPHAIAPNRVRVLPAGWTLNALRASPYAPQVADMQLGIPPPHAVIDIRARSVAALKARRDAVLAYLLHLVPPEGATLNTSFMYSRDDCSTAIDTALYAATHDAVAKAGGRVRYLEEDFAWAIGPVSCTFEADEHTDWVNSTAIPDGASAGGVVAGY